MARKKEVKPQREMTRRQLSRWQRQKRMQHLITGIFILVCVAIGGILLTGWYMNDYRPLHEVVIKVNDTEFDMNYYVKVLKYYGALTGSSLYSIADYVVSVIQQDELVRQAALELGITVSNDEVDELLNTYDPPLSKDYRELVRGELLRSKLLNEYFDTQVPVSAEQRHVLAMFLEGERQASEVRQGLESDGDFTSQAGELSLELITKVKNGDLSWNSREILSLTLETEVPAEYAFDAEAGVISQPLQDTEQVKDVGYWLIKVLERKETEEIHVQAMLLGSEEEAQNIRDRLQAGEDFAELAREFSQDELSREDGGDMESLYAGTMSEAFDAYAFDPETQIGAVSQPIKDETVQTTGGYWLVKVVEIDNDRELTEEDRQLLKNNALEQWEIALRDDPENTIESYLDSEKMNWAINYVASD